MPEQHLLVAQVAAAREDMDQADALIRAYLPFIRSVAAKAMGRPCTDQDDELSVAMIAFHEATRSYTRSRGAFLRYAALVMRSRIIDFQRSEARHRGHASMDTPLGEEEQPLAETLPDTVDHYETSLTLLATNQEVQELKHTLAGYGLRLSDVAENCPKQKRTLDACRKVVRYAKAHPDILDELVRSGKLPLTRLVAETGVERKTLERHRKYLMALLLIYTNGFEIIRGHVCQILEEKGGGKQ